MSSSLFLDRPVILVKRSLHVKETSSSCRRWPSFRFQNQTLGRLLLWNISLSCPNIIFNHLHIIMKSSDKIFNRCFGKTTISWLILNNSHPPHHPYHILISYHHSSYHSRFLAAFLYKRYHISPRTIRSPNLQILIVIRYQIPRRSSWQPCPPWKTASATPSFFH